MLSIKKFYNDVNFIYMGKDNKTNDSGKSSVGLRALVLFISRVKKCNKNRDKVYLEAQHGTIQF